MDPTSPASPETEATRALAVERAHDLSILDGMSEGLVLVDRDFRVMGINSEGLRLEGRSKSEIVGKTHWQVWPGSEQSELGRLYKKAMTERVPVALNHHYTWDEGSDAWLEMRAFPTQEGLAIFYRDVSAHRRAEAQLQEARVRAEASAAAHAAILRQFAEGVIVTDVGGRITLVNRAAADIHGVDRLDVAPEDYADTHHLFTEDGLPYDPQSLPLARAVHGETVTDARWRIRQPDGAEVLAIGSARPLLDQDGVQVGAVLTLRDDTAREAAERSLRASEARLRDLAETLEQRVRERTRELDAARQEADAARLQAEAANKAKSDFLASMSHEIRTPLHGVLGLADLLLNSPGLTEEQQHRLTRLQSAGAALLTVVNDILDFSKIEAGRIELEAKPFRLPGLVDNALSIVRAAAEEKGLRLAVVLAGVLPDRLLGDEARLRQVLLNLLNNAIKFTPSGSVTLEVEGSLVDGPRCGLRFAVVDTGIGVPKDQAHRLFDRFSQIDGSIRRKFGGTGLGLAISRRLVELMGGTIDVVSEEGRGSTFFFELALPIVGGAEPDVPVQASQRPTTPGARILVVDDVELNLEIVRAVLEKAGHAVDAVMDGADAVGAVQAKAYDLVLMDVQMPGMDGMAATQHIRALSGAAAAVPIIAMTANVLPRQVLQFRTAGMDDHVGKPFQHEELYAVIARWRAGRKV